MARGRRKVTLGALGTCLTLGLSMLGAVPFLLLVLYILLEAGSLVAAAAGFLFSVIAAMCFIYGFFQLASLAAKSALVISAYCALPVALLWNYRLTLIAHFYRPSGFDTWLISSLDGAIGLIPDLVFEQPFKALLSPALFLCLVNSSLFYSLVAWRIVLRRAPDQDSGRSGCAVGLVPAALLSFGLWQAGEWIGLVPALRGYAAASKLTASALLAFGAIGAAKDTGLAEAYWTAMFTRR